MREIISIHIGSGGTPPPIDLDTKDGTLPYSLDRMSSYWLHRARELMPLRHHNGLMDAITAAAAAAPPTYYHRYNVVEYSASPNQRWILVRQRTNTVVDTWQQPSNVMRSSHHRSDNGMTSCTIYTLVSLSATSPHEILAAPSLAQAAADASLPPPLSSTSSSTLATPPTVASIAAAAHMAMQPSADDLFMAHRTQLGIWRHRITLIHGQYSDVRHRTARWDPNRPCTLVTPPLDLVTFTHVAPRYAYPCAAADEEHEKIKVEEKQRGADADGWQRWALPSRDIGTNERRIWIAAMSDALLYCLPVPPLVDIIWSYADD